MNVNIPTPQPSDVTYDVHVTQVTMNVNIPTLQASDVTSDVHVMQVNMNVNIPTPPNPVTKRTMCMWRKLTWTLTSPPPNPVT